MLDAQFVADNLELVRQNCVNRNVKTDLDRVPALVADRKNLSKDVQAIQAKQNELARSTGKEKDAAKRQALIEEGRALRAQVGELEANQKTIDEEQFEIISNELSIEHGLVSSIQQPQRGGIDKPRATPWVQHRLIDRSPKGAR